MDDEVYDDEPSLQDFKEWMERKEKVRKQHEMIGERVEPKIPLKRLIERISVAEGREVIRLAREFKKYGGVITEVSEDNMLLIEVASGSFYISKVFTRLLD